MRNHIQTSEASAEIAASAGSTSVAMKGAEGYCVVAEVTVTTPAAKTFVDGDVGVAANTITETAHGFKTGLKGQLTTDGVLPAGLAAATDYFVIVVDADTYKLAASLANAQAGTAVDITAAAGGGTHTFTATSLAGASVKLQASLDGSVWVDVASSSSNITATGNFIWNVDSPYYDYVRAYYTLTAGQISTETTMSIKG